MITLDIDTTDPDFLKYLQTTNIEGIHISRRLEAATSPDQWLLLTLQIAVTAAPLLIHWLAKRLPQKTAHKTTINDIDVSHNASQI